MIVKTETIENPEFFIIGISVRTINQNGQSKKDLMALWEQFEKDQVYFKIPDKLSTDFFCIYTDYETDYTGYYTAVLGYKVNSLTNIPEGFVGITVPGGKYNVYTLGGKCPQNVYVAWQQIWKSGAERRYTADFDQYSPNIVKFEDTEVKIYVGIK